MDPLQAVYLSRRLAETRRSQELAASIQFDLARSSLNDDQLEQATNSFTGTEQLQHGWGISTVLNDLMTREPKRVPVADMQKFQQNLVNLGYASPLTVASGVWDPSWYGAARRFDRDMQEGQMAGKTMLAAPLRQGIELLGQTMPSSIYRNIVGWAKGFTAQTPETVSRVGALGGAVSGAAIGGMVGGPIGAGAGAVIGGALGFFGDLLSHDASEAPDQSVWDQFVDALSPWTEYHDDPKAFWEDLGYVGTVASMIGGAKLAVSGLQAAASPAAMGAAMGPGDVSLGLPGSLVRWGTGKIAPGSVEAVTNAIARVSPIAQLSKYPAFATANSVFTGLSTASVGIHLTAGLGQGANKANEDLRTQAASLVQASISAQRPLTQEEMDLVDRANRGIGVGTIEKAIAGTDVPGQLSSLNVGPQVFGMPLSDWLLPSNLLDISSFFLWPQKLLPIVPGAIASTITKAADVPLGGGAIGIAHAWKELSESEHMARPFIQYFTGDGISTSEARAFYKEHMTPAMVANLYTEAGTEARTARNLHEMGVETPDNLLSHSQQRWKLIKTMHDEGTASPNGRSSTALGVYGEMVARSEAMYAHLVENFNGQGKTRRQAMQDYIAVKQLDATTDAAMRQSSSREFMAGAEGVTPVQISRLPEGVMTLPYGKVTVIPDAVEFERKAQALEGQAAKLRDAQFATTATPKMLMEREAQIADLQKQAADLRALIDTGEQQTRWRELSEYRVTAARADTPLRKDWTQMNAQYRSIWQRMETARKQARKALGEIETPGFASPAFLQAHQELRDLLSGWLEKGLVTESQVNDALGGKFSKRLSRSLTANAKAAAIDADVPPAIRAQYEALGYKPAITGANTISPFEAEKWVEATGIGDYTRRRSFFDMIGVREKVGIEKDLWMVRQANERSELGQVAESLGIRRTARDIYNKLYTHMESINHAGVVKGPFNIVREGGETGKIRLFKIDIRMIKPKDIMDALEGWLPPGKEWDSAMAIYGALRRGAAYGGEWKGLSKIQTARSIGHALGLTGLPGFSEVIRTMSLEDPLNWAAKGITANKLSKAKYAAKGAVVGAVAGAVSGDEPSDIAAGAAIGAVGGLALRGFAGKAYGYLPDALVQLNSALRFTLSATFDAGRYSEQAMIGMAKYSLPPGATFAPKRYARSAAPGGVWKSPFTGTVAAEDAWPQIMQHWDEVNGTKWFQQLDELEGRMYQRGLLGFSPRNVEAMQAWLLYQRGWGREAIEEATKTIGRYGLGRSAAEKSMNFVFFPFSFSKKLLSTLGDWAISAPGRNLMVYEGLRRYYESTLDENFHSLIEDHLPLLEQLSRVNNLTYGLSPGRWFLKGLGDPRTNEGKAAFILSSFFVPGGLATPVAGTAGTAADLAVNMFVPIVLTGEAIDRLGGIDGVDDMVARYIPLSREIQQYWGAIGEQKTAILQGRTPWAQVEDYLDAHRSFIDGVRPMAGFMGYSSPEGFLQSNAGAPWKAQWDQLNIELAQKYPSATETLGNFEDRTQQSAQMLYEIAHKEDRSPAEGAVLDIAKTIETYERMKTLGFLQGPFADRAESMAVREMALKHSSDRRFQELYALLYYRDFGPLEVAA